MSVVRHWVPGVSDPCFDFGCVVFHSMPLHSLFSCSKFPRCSFSSAKPKASFPKPSMLKRAAARPFLSASHLSAFDSSSAWFNCEVKTEHGLAAESNALLATRKEEIKI